MEKLEPKHLAPYLTHEVKIKAKKDYNFCGIKMDQEIFELEGISENHIKFFGIGGFYPISDFKLILRPLSDLTKEIEVNGEKFIPASKMITHGFHNEFWNNPSIEHMYYHDVQKLFEWHFNVFNLPNHLWIDINTI